MAAPYTPTDDVKIILTIAVWAGVGVSNVLMGGSIVFLQTSLAVQLNTNAAALESGNSGSAVAKKMRAGAERLYIQAKSNAAMYTLSKQSTTSDFKLSRGLTYHLTQACPRWCCR